MHILTGMHRSGTSLTALLLKGAGADLGEPADLYPADRWNPSGYFENLQVRDLNCRLLHGPVGRLAYFHLPSEETIRRRGERLKGEIGRLGASNMGRLIKDPRFTITAPIWAEQGLEIERLLICLREPIEVAESLKRRNWITLGMGLRLWEEHYRRLMRFVDKHDAWWIRYSDLLEPATSSREVAGAARYLGLPWDEPCNAGWVRDTVRPPRRAGRAIDPTYPEGVKDLWEELCARHARQLRV